MIPTKKKIFKTTGATAPVRPIKQQSVESDYDDAETNASEDETYTGAAVKEAKTTRPIGKPQAKTGGSSKGSLASRFNAIAKSFSNNASDVAPGLYEAIIREAVLQAPDAKGQSVRVKVELCDDEFKDKNQLTQWFRILDAEGEPFEPGVRSLAYNFARLGFELDFDDLEDTLAEITEDKPGIIAKVSNNEGTGANAGRMFTNVNIEKPCNNDVVQAYKDTVVF